MTSESVRVMTQLPERADSHVSVHSDLFRMSVNAFNFALIFGASDLGPGRISAIDVATVHVSPQMAKWVLLQLQASVSAFEDVYGELTIPGSLSSQIEPTRNQMLKSFKLQNQKVPGA